MHHARGACISPTNGALRTKRASAARSDGKFAEQFGLIDDRRRIDPRVWPGSSTAGNIDRILSEVLGTGILNGQLDSVCAGFLQYDADTAISCDGPRKIGLILFHHGTRTAQAVEGYNPKTDRAATPVGRQRDLTDTEVNLAEGQGLDTIDLSKVLIEHVPESLVQTDLGDDRLAWYVAAGTHPYTIFVPEHIVGENDSAHFTEDFTAGSGIERQSILIHELTHLHQRHDPDWQYAAGGSVEELDLSAYGYRTATGRLRHDDFHEYTAEQQAEIMSDRFRLRNGREPDFNTCRVNPALPCNRPSGLTLEQMYNQLDGLKNIPDDGA